MQLFTGSNKRGRKTYESDFCYAGTVLLVLVLLTIVGSASPLLTLAWLWQVKEWRVDRLLEHLRREGFL